LDLVVVEGSEFEVTAISNTNLTLNVRYDLEAADLEAAVEANDDSTLADLTVVNSEDVTRSGRVYTGDKLVVLAADGTTEVEYRITVNAISTNDTIQLVSGDREVISALGSSSISVFPQTVTGEVNYTDIDENDILGEIDFNKHVQTYELLFWDEEAGDSGEYVTWQAADELENLVIRVFAQDHVDEDNDNYKDYTVNVLAENSRNVITLETDREAVYSSSTSSLTVNKHILDEFDEPVEVDENDILAELNFEENFQTYELALWNETNEEYEGWVPADGLENLVIRVFAQNSTSAAENVRNYTIALRVSSTNTITVVEEPVVIATYTSSTISVYPQYVDSGFIDTTDVEILADLDFDANFQSYEVEEYDEGLEEYGTWGGDIENMFITVIAENGTSERRYEVIVLDPISVTTIVASDVEDAVEFSVSGNTITVEFGSTTADIEDAIDLDANFQTVEFYQNDGITSKTGTLKDYNYVRIIAQDETEKDYLVMVADEVVVPAEPSDSTDISTFDGVVGTEITVAADTEVDDLIADLEDEFEDMTFEILTSSESAKTKDALYSYDLLVVTAEDGETTETYTIIVQD